MVQLTDPINDSIYRFARKQPDSSEKIGCKPEFAITGRPISRIWPDATFDNEAEAIRVTGDHLAMIAKKRPKAPSYTIAIRKVGEG